MSSVSVRSWFFKPKRNRSSDGRRFSYKLVHELVEPEGQSCVGRSYRKLPWVCSHPRPQTTTRTGRLVLNHWKSLDAGCNAVKQNATSLAFDVQVTNATARLGAARTSLTASSQHPFHGRGGPSPTVIFTTPELCLRLVPEPLLALALNRQQLHWRSVH